MTDPCLLPATRLTQMLRDRTIGCRELLDLHLARQAKYDGDLNAVIWQDPEAARARADAADAALAKGETWGPLHGLPMTVKESFDVTGAPTTWGIPAYRDNRATSNAVAVQRLIDAGAIVYGKTNVPLLLSDWQSFNEIYGTTNNPWDLTKTPGGSSGGSAVALATGMAALELGSDIGASIRNPAHYCGVCGHKPTHNLVPTRGQSVSGTVAIPDISVAGPLARTAEDLALGLSVTAGADAIEAAGLDYRLPPPRHRSLADYRIAVMVEDLNSAVDSDYQAKIVALAEALAKAGATVSFEARPAIDTVAAFRLYVALLRSYTFARTAAEEIALWQERAKGYAADDFSYKAMVARAASLSYRDWLALNEERHQLRWRWHAFFQEWDVLLCPAAAGPAFPHDQAGERVDRLIQVNGAAENTCHQLFWAGFSGVAFLPSTVCPLPRHASGLPLGLQIVAPHLEDRTSIELARLIGEAFGGFEPPPGYS